MIHYFVAHHVIRKLVTAGITCAVAKGIADGIAAAMSSPGQVGYSMPYPNPLGVAPGAVREWQVEDRIIEGTARLTGLVEINGVTDGGIAAFENGTCFMVNQEQFKKFVVYLGEVVVYWVRPTNRLGLPCGDIVPF